MDFVLSHLPEWLTTFAAVLTIVFLRALPDRILTEQHGRKIGENLLSDFRYRDHVNLWGIFLIFYVGFGFFESRKKIYDGNALISPRDIMILSYSTIFLYILVAAAILLVILEYFPAGGGITTYLKTVAILSTHIAFLSLIPYPPFEIGDIFIKRTAPHMDLIFRGLVSLLSVFALPLIFQPWHNFVLNL